MLVFYIKNVTVRGEPEYEKYIEKLARLDKEAFEFFFENFPKDGMLGEDSKEISNDGKELIDRFVKMEDPGEGICPEMDA